MKLSHILMLFIPFFLITCGTDDHSNTNSTAIVGKWKVTEYIDKVNNETDSFSGMTFDFRENGKLEIMTGSQSYSGTWQQVEDSGKSKLFLGIASGNIKLNELSDDWDLVEITNSIIRLRKTSGGDGHLSTLIFMK